MTTIGRRTRGSGGSRGSGQGLGGHSDKCAAGAAQAGVMMSHGPT